MNAVQASGTHWECGSIKLYWKDCPKCIEKMEKKNKKEVNLAQAKTELEEELTRYGIVSKDDNMASTSSW